MIIAVIVHRNACQFCDMKCDTLAHVCRSVLQCISAVCHAQAPKLLLKDDGTCLLQELTPGCSYEVQFQITTGDDITDWLPVTPPSVTLPGVFTVLPGSDVIASSSGYYRMGVTGTRLCVIR